MLKNNITKTKQKLKLNAFSDLVTGFLAWPQRVLRTTTIPQMTKSMKVPLGLRT